MSWLQARTRSASEVPTLRWSSAMRMRMPVFGARRVLKGEGLRPGSQRSSKWGKIRNAELGRNAYKPQMAKVLLLAVLLSAATALFGGQVRIFAGARFDPKTWAKLERIDVKALSKERALESHVGQVVE